MATDHTQNSLLVVLNELHVLLFLVDLLESLIELAEGVLIGLGEVGGLGILG